MRSRAPWSQTPRRHALCPNDGTRDPEEELQEMSDVIAERGITTAPAPLASPGELLPYAIFAGVVLFVRISFAARKEGVPSRLRGKKARAFVHDGRHLLGFPCH